MSRRKERRSQNRRQKSVAWRHERRTPTYVYGSWDGHTDGDLRKGRRLTDDLVEAV